MTTEVRVSGNVDFNFSLQGKKGTENIVSENGLAVVQDAKTLHVELSDPTDPKIIHDVLVIDFPKHALIRIGRGLEKRRNRFPVRLQIQDSCVRVKGVPEEIFVGKATLHVTHITQGRR